MEVGWESLCKTRVTVLVLEGIVCKRAHVCVCVDVRVGDECVCGGDSGSVLRP